MRDTQKQVIGVREGVMVKEGSEAKNNRKGAGSGSDVLVVLETLG